MRSLTAVGVGLSIGGLLIGCALSPSDPGRIKPNESPDVFFLNTLETVIDTTLEELVDGIGRTFIDTTLTLVAPDVNYSSIISWYGTDVDDFIDYYEYAIRPAEETIFTPAEFATLTSSDAPDSAWQTTSTTNDTVLFPAPTLRDRHRLWLRAVDSRGRRSELKFADFIAMTDPPTISLSSSEEEIEQGLCPPDSVFALAGPTPSWSGITYSWQADDTDGTIAGYYYWIDDGDRMWIDADDAMTTFTPPDEASVDRPAVTLTFMSSGDHTFYVSAMDDAGAISPIPSRYTIHVDVPTFHEDLLIVADSDNDFALADLPLTNDQYKAFYRDAAVAAGLAPGGDPTVITPDELTRQHLADHATVFWATDNATKAYRNVYPLITGIDPAFLARRAALLEQYLEVGGNLLFEGTLGATVSTEDTDYDGKFSVLEPWFGIEFNPDEGYTDGLFDKADSSEATSMLDVDADWKTVPGGDPVLDPKGAFTGGIGSLAETDPATPLYWDVDGDLVAVTHAGSHHAVGATALVLFPMQTVLPVFTDSADYTDAPWEILSEDQQAQVVKILRDLASGMGLL